jgi:hypothetical protein
VLIQTNADLLDWLQARRTGATDDACRERQAHYEHMPDVSPLGRLRLAVVAVRVSVKGLPQRLFQGLEVVFHPDA